MHGSYAANMGMTETDALIPHSACVSTSPESPDASLAFAPHAKVIQCRYRPGGDRQDSYAGDSHRRRREAGSQVTVALEETAGELPAIKMPTSRAAWWGQIKEWQREHPYNAGKPRRTRSSPNLPDGGNRPPVSGGEAIVSSDVERQHQMWGAPIFIPLTIIPGCGSTRAASGPWDSDCRRPSARSSAIPTNWSSRLSGDGGFKCRFRNSRPSLITPCR